MPKAVEQGVGIVAAEDEGDGDVASTRAGELRGQVGGLACGGVGALARRIRPSLGGGEGLRGLLGGEGGLLQLLAGDERGDALLLELAVELLDDSDDAVDSALGGRGVTFRCLHVVPAGRGGGGERGAGDRRRADAEPATSAVESAT